MDGAQSLRADSRLRVPDGPRCQWAEGGGRELSIAPAFSTPRKAAGLHKAEVKRYGLGLPRSPPQSMSNNGITAQTSTQIAPGLNAAAGTWLRSLELEQL